MAATTIKKAAAPKKSSPSLLVQYTQLLHEHRTPDAADVRTFYDAHANDPVFVRRADVLNKLSRAKSVATTTRKQR
jgi:hypothetical protein